MNIELEAQKFQVNWNKCTPLWILNLGVCIFSGIINSYQEGKEALKEYAEKHKKNKSREMYIYHTKHENLLIEERTWIGVRKNG